LRSGVLHGSGDAHGVSLAQSKQIRNDPDQYIFLAAAANSQEERDAFLEMARAWLRTACRKTISRDAPPTASAAQVNCKRAGRASQPAPRCDGVSALRFISVWTRHAPEQSLACSRAEHRHFRILPSLSLRAGSHGRAGPTQISVAPHGKNLCHNACCRRDRCRHLLSPQSILIFANGPP
jgi:hypothetical protein